MRHSYPPGGRLAARNLPHAAASRRVWRSITRPPARSDQGDQQGKRKPARGDAAANLGPGGEQPRQSDGGLGNAQRRLSRSRWASFPAKLTFLGWLGTFARRLGSATCDVKLLLYMAHSPRFQVFFDSLPVSGIDGTLAHRFSGDDLKGKIHAKTGVGGARQHALRLHGLALGKTPGLLDYGQQSSPRQQGRPGKRSTRLLWRFSSGSQSGGNHL